MEKPSRSALTVLAIAAAASMQAYPFLRPFRMSADDVNFLSMYLDGPQSLLPWSHYAAVSQGRIGQYAMTTLNVYGAAFSGDIYYRSVFIILYFMIFLLFSLYTAFLLKARISVFLFAVSISMHPLAYESMPPTSYPLQNTIPFLLIMVVRISILKRRQGISNIGKIAAFVLNMIFFGCMLVTEYAFLFGTSLLFAEHLIHMVREKVSDDSSSPRRIFVSVATRSAFIIDVAITVSVLTLYITYRIFNPSSYDGNSLDALNEVGRFSTTTLRHVIDGTIFPRLGELSPVPIFAAVIAAIVGMLTAWAIYQSARQCESLRSPEMIIAVVVVLMIYVTFPVTAAAKQQMRCINGEYCGFLDSRTSYLGVCIVTVAVTASIYKRLNTRLKDLYIWLVASMIGLAGSAAYAMNWKTSEGMKPYIEPWQKADLLRCHKDLMPLYDETLPKILDPSGKIMFYPGVNQVRFWHRYIDDKRRPFRHCSSQAGEIALEREYIKSFSRWWAPPARFTFYGDGASSNLLSAGFSDAEPWGTWSVGHWSHIVLPLSRGAPTPTLVRLDLGGFVPPQRPEQSIRVALSSWRSRDAGWVEDSATVVTLTAADPRRVVELARTPAAADAIRVTLSVNEPVSPQSLGISADQRELGAAVFELAVD